jgi:predicted Holliday junction resolvase-like endonuclease
MRKVSSPWERGGKEKNLREVQHLPGRERKQHSKDQQAIKERIKNKVENKRRDACRRPRELTTEAVEETILRNAHNAPERA